MPGKKNLLIYPKSALERARQLRRQMTVVEKLLWGRLRSNRAGVHFRRQVPFGPYILDFLCKKAKLALELDGGQHFQGKEKSADRKRDEYLKEHGLTVLRLSDHDFLTNPEGVMEKIHAHIKNH